MDKLKRIEELKAELGSLQNEMVEELEDKWLGKIIRIEEDSYKRISYFHVESVDEDCFLGSAIFLGSEDNEIDFDVYEEEYYRHHLEEGKQVTMDDIKKEMLEASERRVDWLLKLYKEEWY